MAVTAVSNLYPPQVDTFMPAFINTDGVTINFSVSPYNSAGSAGADGFYSPTIRSIHIVVLDQKTNQDALGATKVSFPTVGEDEDEYDTSNVDYAKILLNRTLIIPFNETYVSYDDATGLYAYKLSVEDLKRELDEKGEPVVLKFKTDQYYKVQLRFDSCDRTALLLDTTQARAITTIDSKTLNYNYLTDNRQYFSEWSSVCLIKAIDQPVLLLSGYRTFDDFTDPDIKQDAMNGILPPARVPAYNPGSFHLTGSLLFTGGTETEYLQSYQISIREKDDLNTPAVYKSDLLYAVAPKHEILHLINFDSAEANSTYYLTVEWTTCNQYTQTDTFQFNINEYEQNLTFSPELNITTNEEDGYIRVNVKGYASTEGNLLIKRSSSIDNFKEWTLVHYVHTSEDIDIEFRDMTVGSLMCYDYAVQFQFAKGTLSPSTTWHGDLEKDYIYPSFYDMLIYRQDKQIAIRCNGQINSFKPVVNRVKVDTLGSKYPRFAENAKMNYKQYTITGLISAEADFNRQFLSEISEDYELDMEYYDKNMSGEYIVRNDTVADGEQILGNTYQSEKRLSVLQNTTHDAYPLNNWYWEREFRESLVAWLNDGEPKLFRSMTEGNLLVMITDVNLTPNKTLGRMLYNFTATIYEVGDGYSLSSLGDAGVINLPEFVAEYVAGEEGEGGSESSRKTVKTVLQTYQWTNNTGAQYDIINGNTDDTSSNPNVSLFDLLNIKYEGGIFENKEWSSLKIKSIKIQFASEPRFYVQGQDGILKLIGNTQNGYIQENTNAVSTMSLRTRNSRSLEGSDTTWNDLGYKPADLSSLDHLYGYKLTLGLTESRPGDTTNITPAERIEIFVNQKGYYQIPTDVQVYELFIESGDTVIVDFVIEYQETKSLALVPSSTTVLEIVAGQLAGPFTAGEFLGDTIKNKYQLTQYDNTGRMIATQYMTYWDGISLDVNPYAVFQVQFYEDKETVFREFVVGRTGVFDLMFDYPVRDIGFMGRRMALNENPYMVEEWEFRPTYEEYTSIAEIDQPQYNHVYMIDGENKIYYIDSKWYDFEYIESGVGLAKVPTNGYVNYIGDLIRSEY